MLDSTKHQRYQMQSMWSREMLAQGAQGASGFHLGFHTYKRKKTNVLPHMDAHRSSATLLIHQLMNKMFRNLVNQLKRKKVIRTVRIVHGVQPYEVAESEERDYKKKTTYQNDSPPTFKNPQYHIHNLETIQRKNI